MNGMKMKKCSGKSHCVVHLLLILSMTSVIHIAVGDFFPCLGSNMNVSVTLVCDGYYNCDNYEDESKCNYSAAYLHEGESHFISLRSFTTPIRLYKATLLQTNATNGFQVMFQDLRLRYGAEVQIGTGNDPSDIQSVITTFNESTNNAADHVSVDTNEMWFAAIAGWQNKYSIEMDVGFTAIDLLNFFPCSGSNMDVSVTLVCDGYYNCDNYKDESLCNYSTTYLEEGKSYFIYIPSVHPSKRLYNVTLLQTNAMIGFRVVFQDVRLYDDYVQIGTGNDPSNNQSVITTIHGRIDYADDVYLDTNAMWFAVIGGKGFTNLRMDVEIISIDLSTLFYCSGSNISVSPTVLCDGHYQCDHFEDELACNYSSTYLEEGESHFIYMYTPSYNTGRLYNATALQTNAMIGFRVVFQDLSIWFDDDVQIGIGTDPSDSQSVITTIDGPMRYAPDDVYVDNNEMWFAVIGAKDTGPFSIDVDVEIISTDLSTLFDCSSSSMSVSLTVLCDGLYHCDYFEDELACDNSATYLQENKPHFIYIPLSRDSRLYNVSLLQTNTTYGFRIVFQYMDLSYTDEVRIGTGNDPSDIQSVITTIQGSINYAPDDVYIGTNEMWFAVIGGKRYSSLEMTVEIISIDLSIDCSGSNPCQNGGTCENYACTCAASFNGVVCSTVDCSGSNPCQNGGTCENNACTCAASLNGVLCSTVDCSGSNPCQNGGICENNACTCGSWYTGALCGDTIGCSGSNPCRNGGFCRDGACTCLVGFQGLLCSTVDCSGSNPCQNGGSCENNACTCAAGFNGALCSTVDCSGSYPCRNGGTCETNACTCAAGFHGALCSSVDCSGSNPCQNGGSCENNTCTCAAGFKGVLCSTVDCSGSNPCRNGGTCETNACTCAAEFHGALCSSVDCSGSNPCHNGGSCKSNACTCAAAFNGVLCSTVDCSGSNPCRNGGTCKNNACTCAAGVYGVLCSTVDCSRSNPCQNGGTCENNACTCAAGFNGALCSTGVASRYSLRALLLTGLIPSIVLISIILVVGFSRRRQPDKGENEQNICDDTQSPGAAETYQDLYERVSNDGTAYQELELTSVQQGDTNHINI